MTNKNILALFFILQLISLQVNSQQFDTFKLFSYEQNQKIIGSRIGSLNMITTHFQSQESMTRKIVLIDFEHVSYESLGNLMQRKPGGVVIILPNLTENQSSQTETWQVIMDFFGNKNMIIPVQFTFSNPTIDQHYTQLKQNLQEVQTNEQENTDNSNINNTQSNLINNQNQQYRLVINGEQSRPLGRISMEDYFAILDENNQNKKKDSILLLVALDQFMPSQEFVNLHDTSLTIFFALMQQFQQIYSQFNIVNQNLIFYVTQSAQFGFEGFQEWIENTDNAAYVNSISSVIYLDNLGASDQIFIEQFGVSNNNISNILTEKLQNQNLKVTSTYFQKDQFPLNFRTNKQIDVIRISDKQYNEIYYLPIQQQPNVKNQLSVITGLTTGLAQLIYPNLEEQLIQKCNFDNIEYTTQLNSLFTSTPRFPSYLQLDSKILEETRKMMKKFRQYYQKNGYLLKDVKFFSSKVGQATLIQYQDPFLNVYIFISAIVYLAILYFVFRKTPIVVKSTKTE